MLDLYYQLAMVLKRYGANCIPIDSFFWPAPLIIDDLEDELDGE